MNYNAKEKNMENQNELFELINNTIVNGQEKINSIDNVVAEGLDLNQVTTASGATLLHLACRLGLLDVVECLHKNKIDVNAQDNYGMTALHTASFWGYKDIVEYLVSHGADWEIKDNTNKKAIFYAKLKNRKEIVDYLTSLVEKQKVKDESKGDSLDEANPNE